MYADRYEQRRNLKPGSLALAVGMTALPIVGLVMSTSIQKIMHEETHLRLEPIAAPKPPPPPDTRPKPQSSTEASTAEKIFAPVPRIDVPTIDPIDTTEVNLPPQPPVPPGAGTGIGVKEPPVAPPVMVGAMIDPRFANAFQPPYPPEEIRAGVEGRVVVRVLIGTDGRVKEVERVSATSDAFFRAAERQALAKWRFKPATRDGTPIEQWKQMSLRFELNDG